MPSVVNKKQPYLIALAVVYLVAAAAAGSSDMNDRRGSGTREDPYIVPRTDAGIKVDAVLDEEFWKSALEIGLNYEVRPGENIQPPVKTEVLLVYSQSHLYAAFRAYDPDPSAIRAHLSDHDHIGGDDWVGIILDTFNDERVAFDFISTPRGVKFDAVEPNGNTDSSWDAIWDCAGRITDWGYVIEMAIPFSSLRFQRTSGAQIWGFDAVRRYPRSKPHHIGAFPRDRGNNCYLCQAIKIKGFEGVSPGRNIEINPTVTALRTDERSDFPSGNLEKERQTADFGLTAHWGVTPNMTVSGTLNPDFSQVEADARQLDINQPFALYFEEKRPFFLEGKDFFSSPRIEAVYTRTLRNPVWGAKLSGKEGTNSIGSFVVLDDITNLIFPGSQYSQSTSLAMQSYATVFRYRRDLGNKYTLGALLTSREGDEYYNRVFGFDGNLRITDKDRLTLQVLASNTRYPDSVAEEFNQPLDSFNDRAISAFYSHYTRTVYWWAGYGNRGRNFRADLGFVPHVDYRLYEGCLGYRWRPENPTWYSEFEVNTMYQYEEDQDGNLLRNRGDLFFYYQGPMQSTAAARYFRQRQAYNGQKFDMTYFGTYTGFTPNKYISAGLDTSFGNKLDYANTRLGNRIRLYPELSLNLSDHLKIYFGHHYEQLKIGSERLYTANISQGTIVYQFSTRTFLRSILQYVDYRYNAALYTFEIDPQFKQLFTQLLFSYKINPRTVLFVGYSDNYFGSNEFGITQADRTFFVKLGYAWVL